MKIAGVVIDRDQPCRFVAEVSNNHNGSLDLALHLIELAKKAGADFVKFQAFTVQELLDLRGEQAVPPAWAAQGYTMRTLYEKAATPLTWFPALFTQAAIVGIPAFSSVFGARSLAALEAVACPAYKLASLDFEAAPLRWMVEETGKPIIRSCPHLYAPAYDGLQLLCPPGYPQTAAMLNCLRHGYQGYSYHGTDPFVPILAAAKGAQLIECHFQAKDQPSVLEANVSLDEEDFAFLVETVRHHERIAA